jgi:RNA polymerase sigma-70 factor, ECF subfamily
VLMIRLAADTIENPQRVLRTATTTAQHVRYWRQYDIASEITMVESHAPADSPSPEGSETDAELAARFEREALPLLDPLYRGALALTGARSDAEDLLEEVMMNAYREFGSSPQGGNLRTSLYRALTNAYISSCRTPHRRLTETISDRQPAAATAHSSTELRLPEMETLEALPAEVITKALQALGQDTRMAVYYADVEHFSYREIADITNRSVSAVMSLLRCGRYQLRNVLLADSREPAIDQFQRDPPNDGALTQCVTSKHAPLSRLSESDTCAGQLDWFDREIVCYVLLWAPYGELWNEDVYPVFGMTVEQLVDRFHRIIAMFVPRLGRLAKSDRELLEKARHLPRVLG